MNASRRTKLHLIFIQRWTSCSRLETWAGRALRRLSRDRKRWCPSITRCCHSHSLFWRMHSLDPCGTALLLKLQLWKNGQITVLGLLCGQRILLSVCWTTSLVEELENLLSGVYVMGKELVDQALKRRRRAGGMPSFSGGCIAVWVGIWELSVGSKLALSNKHFDSSWKRRKANFSEGSGTVSQEKISSWSCSEYNLVCKPKAAELLHTHAHNRAQSPATETFPWGSI